MKFWTCTGCGNVERLNIFPDCCSACSSPMICDDGRTTNGRVETHVLDCFELRTAAAEGDPEANVILWQECAPTRSFDQDMIDTLLLQNRIAMMQAIYSEAA